MNHTGKPDAGSPPVRFDEGDGHGVSRAIVPLLKINVVMKAFIGAVEVGGGEKDYIPSGCDRLSELTRT